MPKFPGSILTLYLFFGTLFPAIGGAIPGQAKDVQQVADSLLGTFGEYEGADYFDHLNNLQFYYYFESPDVGEILLQFGLENLDSAQYPKQYANQQLALGMFAERRGENTNAISAYYNALAVFEVLNKRDDISDTYNSLGNVYLSQGEYEASSGFYQKSLEGIDSLSDPSKYGTILNNIGEVYFEQEEYEKAYTYYQRSYNLLSLNADSLRYDVVVPLHNLGRVYRELGQYDKALKNLKGAYEVDQALADLEGMAIDNLEIGKVYINRNQLDSAEFHLRNAIIQGQRVEAYNTTQEAMQLIASILQKLGRYREAVVYQSRYRMLTDSVIAWQNFADIHAIQSAFEKAQVSRELERLRRDQEVEEFKLKETNLQAVSFIITFVLVLVVLGVLLWQYRTNARASTMLNASNDKLEAQNEDLEYINEQLEASERSLQEVNATKDKFFSIISHDLKSPLNSLIGLLNILLKYGSGLSQEELMDLTQKIDGSVKALTDLLDNLLKWSMAQTDAIDYLPRVLDLKAEVERTVKLLSLNADQKSITIETRITPGTKIFADQDMVSFIVRNLVSNALKFTFPGGKIVVQTNYVEDGVMLRVSDNGMGISPENQEKLFRIDSNVSTKGTQNETGTGLGLVLIKEFVEKNQGRISVQSKQGEGTTFTVTFPALILTEEDY